MSGHRIRVAGAEPALAAALAEVLIDCVEGGASVGFLAPLTHARALAFWEGWLAAVARGERLLLVAEAGDGRVDGTVSVSFAAMENQPQRGELNKMLVHRRARRAGLGAALVAAAEAAACAAGRRLLILDAVSGGDAERLYARLGWQRVGAIPDYALWPDGRRCSTTYYYKQIAR